MYLVFRYAKLQNTTYSYFKDTTYDDKIVEISNQHNNITNSQINNNNVEALINDGNEKTFTNSNVDNIMHNNIDETETLHNNQKIEITVDEHFITYVNYPNDKNEVVVRNSIDNVFVNGNDATNLISVDLNTRDTDMEVEICKNKKTLQTLYESNNMKLCDTVKLDSSGENSCNRELGIINESGNEPTLRNLSNQTISDVRKNNCESLAIKREKPETEEALKDLSKVDSITKSVISDACNNKNTDGDNNNIVSVKKEDDSDEDIIKLLNEFGPNCTTTIFDIYDPFLVIELSSDSSDEEFE